MGLMSNTKTHAKMAQMITNHHKKLSMVCYVAGIAYFFALAYPPLNAHTYFSENALLPGLVEREFSTDENAKMYTKELLEVIKKHDSLPVDWLSDKFSEIGLEVYLQNFTSNHPFLERYGKDSGKMKIVEGNNVYGILRAPRIASTEAVVVTVPYRGRIAEHKYGATNHGIAMMLAMAKFFRGFTYWSKDVIFVVVDEEYIGMEAWLTAYHSLPSEYIQSSPMIGRSGPIMGAVNLEQGSEFIDSVDIRIEGVNGQLPNLDLFNLVVNLCEREGIPVTFQGNSDPPYRGTTWGSLKKSLDTMMKNLAHQATGRPRGLHGLFLKYRVEAITVHTKMSPVQSGQNFRAMGRILEGIFRSLNNLLERFHQSFFFYFLAATHRYISIGLYMPPFGLVIAPSVFHGLAMWIASGNSLDEEDKLKEKPKQKLKIRESRPFASIVPIIIGAYITGMLLHYSPVLFTSKYSSLFGLTPTEAVPLGVVAFYLGSAFLPIISGRSWHKIVQGQSRQCEWQLLKCFGLIWHAITVFSIALTNFALGYFLSVVITPVYLLIRPQKRRFFTILQALLLLCLCPPFLLYFGLLTYCSFVEKFVSVGNLLVSAFSLWQEGLLAVVTDSYLHSGWSLGLAALVIFPNWFIFWVLNLKKVE
ncbi:glycosylphosphatidylinositol anchor attachment 1 protein-like [Anneissia japonica]|uniref:glycosylphosphatidylinositol anchor attachment 1 protein-like n=1 Tax=Anneissia japonica TaxID=1529436 RepID=UPI0014256159|nr:glycosylphosphatidylinositol anchor attachment 1 protein-like [Anneissia japonica]